MISCDRSLAIGCTHLTKERFDRFVAHEEESSAWRRASQGGTYAGVDASEASRCLEAMSGLESSFEGVDGVEGEID